jgi:hypothetical protein
MRQLSNHQGNRRYISSQAGFPRTSRREPQCFLRKRFTARDDFRNKVEFVGDRFRKNKRVKIAQPLLRLIELSATVNSAHASSTRPNDWPATV